MNELLGWYGYENSRDSKSMIRNCRSQSESNSSGLDSPKLAVDACGWCGKQTEDSPNRITSGGSTFCSDSCFSQSRRANFKKNKTCDWCRHVRHTVSYVDFQDGASQLQFCSDKCLNQYKMHIFCRETTAHLELHPHLHNEDSVTNSSNLITPDLWLRNCKSPEVCIDSSIDTSPEEEHLLPLPLVARPQVPKLDIMDVSKRNRNKMHKKRRRYPATITSSAITLLPNDVPQDLRIRHSPPVNATPTTTTNERLSTLLNDNLQSKSLPFTSNKDVIDLNPSHPLAQPTKPFQITTLNKPLPSNVENSNQSQSSIKSIIETLLPPQTVFVPYPVILPLPIPIPIPIPIPKIFTVKEKSGEIVLEKKDSSSQTEVIANEVESSDNPEIVVKVDDCDKLNVKKRPIRKRKKVVDNARSKRLIKTRKVQSSSVN